MEKFKRWIFNNENYSHIMKSIKELHVMREINNEYYFSIIRNKDKIKKIIKTGDTLLQESSEIFILKMK